MKNRNKKRLASLLLTLLLLVIIATPTMASQTPVNLGTTSSFAVLAGSTITNTGTTTITGNIGLHPGTAFTGQASVTVIGTVHLTNAVALQAKDDLVIAYNDAAGRTPVITIPSELGGTTLTPGVYNSADGTFQITGTLTLDAQGDPEAVFVFKTAATLITAAGSNVNLIGRAQFCRIFWQTGSSATLGTNSRFVGHILALESITANTGATVQGRLLARNGAVTLDSNTITIEKPTIAPLPLPLINVTKTASPLALTGSGLVTFTFAVTNPGVVALNSVRVTDDKVSPVSYVSGDVNADSLLQPGETWIFTGTSTLNATTTNIATATGSANNITATATAVATVIVTPIVIAPPPPVVVEPTITPLINVTKTASPLALTGSGLVTFAFAVTNPGVVALNSVRVTDDKVSPVSYVSGDVNADSLLQPGETWIFTGTSTLNATTTNIATATGSANNITATATAVATVIVTPIVIAPPPPVVVEPTITPLINVTKTASPLALTGSGLVTFTFAVTNPGVVALNSVRVTDDKVSPVSYVSGDVNADSLLQPGETWIFTGTSTLSATTTNIATATGSANNITATATAVATVIVTPIVIAPPPPVVVEPTITPLINVTKTASPLALTGSGLVTFTFAVTNPGVVALNSVNVTDDKVSPVSYVSGDVNADSLLQPGETWIFTGTSTLSETTTNIATATGSANNITATATAVATVIVTTVTGGTLPDTATRLYELFLAGVALMLVGAVGWRIRRRYA